MITLYTILVAVSQIIALIIPLLIGVAYLTLLERKVIGGMQRRQGPSKVGAFGLLQPLADGLKLFLKETILPGTANTVIFLVAPALTFVLALIAWAVLPMDWGAVLSDLPVGILYILAVSSLNVYGVILSGWGSNSKYAFLGALRSTAQMVSYEISIGLIILNVMLCAGSLNLSSIVNAQEDIFYYYPLFPLFIMFIISILAETNRHPFDLPEAEAELVSGYNIEYSSMGFALFFIGEYANIILMCSFCVILFMGGWLPFIEASYWQNEYMDWIPNWIWFSLKVFGFLFFFIWVRAALPRYRYDQLMKLGWKVFLPLALGCTIFNAGLLYAFDGLPY